jgi:transmembrane protein
MNGITAESTVPKSIAILLDNPVTLLVTRVYLALPFFVAGLFKLMDWQGGVAEMAHVGLSPPWLSTSRRS